MNVERAHTPGDASLRAAKVAEERDGHSRRGPGRGNVSGAGGDCPQSRLPPARPAQWPRAERGRRRPGRKGPAALADVRQRQAFALCREGVGNEPPPSPWRGCAWVTSTVESSMTGSTKTTNAQRAGRKCLFLPLSFT